MKFTNLAYIWPLLLIVNIVINSLVLYFTLEIAVFAILKIETDISFLEAVAITTILLVIRGSFILRLAEE